LSGHIHLERDECVGGEGEGPQDLKGQQAPQPCYAIELDRLCFPTSVFPLLSNGDVYGPFASGFLESTLEGMLEAPFATRVFDDDPSHCLPKECVRLSPFERVESRSRSQASCTRAVDCSVCPGRSLASLEDANWRSSHTPGAATLQQSEPSPGRKPLSFVAFRPCPGKPEMVILEGIVSYQMTNVKQNLVKHK
jgi:hypothetical protein